MGFRSYDCEVYNDPEFGIMVPLAFTIRDLEYLTTMRSPLRAPLDQLVEDPSHVKEIASLMGEPFICAVDEMESAQKEEIFDCLLDASTALFDSMTKDEIRPIIAKGHLMELAEGDLMIRKSQQTATVFIVLSGKVAVEQNGKIVRYIKSGETVGELGFLLEARRSANVYVASENAVVLSLDESRLKQRIRPGSPKVSRLLYNLCNILASRIANSTDVENFEFRMSSVD